MAQRAVAPACTWLRWTVAEDTVSSIVPGPLRLEDRVGSRVPAGPVFMLDSGVGAGPSWAAAVPRWGFVSGDGGLENRTFQMELGRTE